MPTSLPAPVRELKEALKKLEASIASLKRVTAKQEDLQMKQKLQGKIKKSS